LILSWYSAEFNKICLQTALGFIVMGFIGFFVKLVFIVSTPSTLCPGGQEMPWIFSSI